MHIYRVTVARQTERRNAGMLNSCNNRLVFMKRGEIFIKCLWVESEFSRKKFSRLIKFVIFSIRKRVLRARRYYCS